MWKSSKLVAGWDLSAVIASVVLGLGTSFASAAPNGNLQQQLFDQTVVQAAEEVAAHLVQLRYLSADNRSATNSSNQTTGLLLDSEGWILTSDFGLPGNSLAVLVTLTDQTEVSAKVVARDFPNRLVLLHTSQPIEPLVGFPKLATQLRPGETIIALGKFYDANQVNYSVGVLSATERLAGRAIQTDANTSPTNYGGVLINLAGEIAGIISPLAPAGQKGEEWYDSGIGFAVPLGTYAEQLEQLKSGKDIYPGWAGVKLAEGNPYADKVVVAGVTGPTAEAGVKAGDQITGVDGAATPTIAKFRRYHGNHNAGDSCEWTLLRKGETLRVMVQLKQRPKETSSGIKQHVLEALTPKLKEASPQEALPKKALPPGH